MDRVAIIGTAPSWTLTPWTDPGLYLVSLNDAYRMKGFVRADAWYDFHPMDRFHYVAPTQGQIFPHQVPAGYYVRPEGHLDWLARQSQTIPVWLHEDYRTQHPAAATWPKAQAIPRTAIEAHFGRYFTSSPALMLAHAILQGAKEIHIYGIHLATEHEYLEQRPNFEFLIGRVLGSGKTRETVRDGLRHYDSPDGSIVLPEASPILASPFRYAIDVRPRTALEPLQWDQHRFSIKRERAVTALKTAKWWQRKAPLQRDVWHWDAWVADTQEQIGRFQAQQQMGAV